MWLRIITEPTIYLFLNTLIKNIDIYGAQNEAFDVEVGRI